MIAAVRLPAQRPVSRALLAATGIATALTAGPAHAETLAEAVALAYARSPILNQERFVQKSRDENYVQARAGYGPTLNLETTGQYNYNSQAGQSTDSDVNQAVVALNQPLYTGGRLRGEVASARAVVRAGQEQLRQLETETVQNVVIAYAGVIRDEARLAVGRENVAVLQDQLRENRARKRVGDVTLTDVGQADSRLAAGESQLATLEANLAISRGQYLQVVGRNPGTLAPLPGLAGLPASIETAYEQAEAANPALSVRRFVEQGSSARAAAARGERGPSVSATVQGVYTNRFGNFGERAGRKQVIAGVTLSQPLFASGAISSRVREADALNSADQVAIDLARRQALQAVTVAWSQLAASRTALIAGERQVSSAQLAFAGMSREQRFGLRSTIDVLNSEQELQAAQLTFLQNRYAEYVARAALLAATGTLRATAVSDQVDVYDPDVNFRRVKNRGLTPLSVVAMGLDRIGSANPRRPLPADLTGDGGPQPDRATVLPAEPGPALTAAPLTPITKSRLIPESELPGGMPRTGTLPERRDSREAGNGRTEGTSPGALAPVAPAGVVPARRIPDSLNRPDALDPPDAQARDDVAPATGTPR